jgi:predicted ester cyclase
MRRILLLTVIAAGLSSPGLAQETEANKEVVRRFIEEVLGKGNVDVMDETHHEQVTMNGPGRLADRDSNKAANARFHETMDDVALTIDEMVAERDIVMGRFTIAGTYAGGVDGVPEATIGKRVSWDGYFQYRLKDGRIVENFWLRNEPAYQRSMGIAPPPP